MSLEQRIGDHLCHKCNIFFCNLFELADHLESFHKIKVEREYYNKLLIHISYQMSDL